MFGRKLKGAIIGFGKIAEGVHYPAFLKHDRITITAIADISPKRRLILKEKIPGLNIYPDYRELFEREELDFIDIATPPYAHAEIIRAAIEQNIHVICEKPLVPDLSKLNNLIERASNNKTIIFPVLNYKRSLAAKRIKEIIDSKQIGDIKHITINIFKPSHHEGVNEWLPHWRRQKKYALGGMLTDYGAHVFSLIHLFLPTSPKVIAAEAFCLDKKWGDEVEDTVILNLQMPDTIVDVNLSWATKRGEVLYLIQGTKGVIRNYNSRYSGFDDSLKYWAKTGAFEEIYPGISSPKHPNWFLPIIGEFVSCIKGEKENTELEEAASGIKLLSKTYESANKHTPIQL